MKAKGELTPLAGKLSSVYDLYNTGESRSRLESHPKYTHYCRDFKVTLDHIMYNREKLEVVEFLEMPAEEMVKREGALPSTLFASDHMRIEAKLFIK